MKNTKKISPSPNFFLLCEGKEKIFLFRQFCGTIYMTGGEVYATYDFGIGFRGRIVCLLFIFYQRQQQ